jgi:hypothetical protein
LIGEALELVLLQLQYGHFQENVMFASNVMSWAVGLLSVMGCPFWLRFGVVLMFMI